MSSRKRLNTNFRMCVDEESTGALMTGILDGRFGVGIENVSDDEGWKNWS